VLHEEFRVIGSDEIRSRVDRYYSGKFAEHGASHWGVDWNSTESQELRFAQLLRVCDLAQPFSINDFGCGYGALARYLSETPSEFTYVGFDLSPDMVAHAAAEHPAHKFTSHLAELRPAHYTLASGIFNVKVGVDNERWQAYVQETLETLARLSTRGFAFNMLTSYSDPERMRPDLYYADPTRYFDVCKRRFSRHVALLHDYGLYEFTILVRLETGEEGTVT
jgi:SAM-dependent methyltransferase